MKNILKEPIRLGQAVSTCIIGGIVLLGAFLTSCENKTEELPVTNEYPILMDVHTSAENIGGWKNDEFVDGDYTFGKSEMQTDEFAHSGTFSCKVQKGHDFGLGVNLEEVSVGDYVEVSVWRFAPHGKGALHVSSSKVGDLYYLVGNSLVIEESGWEKIVINVPILEEIDILKVACFNPNENPVYFDDLSIKVFKSRPIYYDKNEAFALRVSDSNMAVLQGFRDKALELGVISKDLKSYVKAEIFYKEEVIPVKIRFKGDWTDHLEGDKWSFRVKVDKGYAFKGLKSFSIQSPHTRSFIHEWFLHRVFENLGLLTTRYDFIPVTLNDKNLGMFALEEHFDKQLLESRGKREGPILKMDEGGFWELNLLSSTGQTRHTVPYYEAAAIMPFKRNRTMKNETLKKEFMIAQNLMYQYKQNGSDIENLFDLESLAQYHALFDLGGIDHGQTWHNQRVYYNPITSKLEPIAYDMYAESLKATNRVPIQGLETLHGESVIMKDMFLNYSVFEQPAFQEVYVKYLKLFSDSSFLNDMYQNNKVIIDSLTQLIEKEYDGYRFEIEGFVANAQKIKVQLPAYESKIQNENIAFRMKSPGLDNLTEKQAYYKETGLKAYMKSKDSLNSEIECINFHMGELNIIGYSQKGSKDSLIRFEQPIQLDGYTTSELKTVLNIDGKVSKLFFTVPSMPNQIKSKKIVAWGYPTTYNPRLELEKPLKEFAKYFTVKGDVITLNLNINLKSVLFIPAGYTVEIQKGTQINLGSGAGILSYSPVRASGDESNPINVTGTSTDNYGVQILTRNDSSVFNYVEFEGMSTLSYQGWQLTGGLTVYRGNVLLENCKFSGNHCEDAVNLINSQFVMNNCVIESTFSDALDADFCTGTVSNCVIKYAGNDGLDFSGSTIKIEDTKVIQPFDKALSGGEASTVSIQNSEISKASLAVVAKDNSVVTVSGVTFTECQVVYSLFQKKDEYGPAKIIGSNIKTVNCGSDYIIDLGSVLELENTSITGDSKQNIDSLYTTSSVKR